MSLWCPLDNQQIVGRVVLIEEDLDLPGEPGTWDLANGEMESGAKFMTMHPKCFENFYLALFTGEHSIAVKLYITDAQNMTEGLNAAQD